MMEMKINMMKKKNFYSNVDWNQWHEYALVNFPRDPEGEGITRNISRLVC